jgi:hypothetical protein
LLGGPTEGALGVRRAIDADHDARRRGLSLPRAEA